jgi:hypothetical protein
VNLVEALGINHWDGIIEVKWTVVAISGDDRVESDDSFDLYVAWFDSNADETPSGIPGEFKVEAVYPNPFNPTMTIVVGLPETASLDISIYNLLGEKVGRVAAGTFNTGYQKFTFDARNLASGIYFVRVYVPGRLNKIEKVMLLR